MLLSVRSDNFIFQVNFICQVNFFLSLVRSKNFVFQVNFVCRVNFCCCLLDQTKFVCCRIILTSFLCRGREGRGGGGENYELSVLEDFRTQRPHRVLQRPRHGLHVSTHVQSPKVICTSSEISPTSPGFNPTPKKVIPDYCPN